MRQLSPVLLLFLISLHAAAQIDVRRYASDDLFAIKPVVTTDQPVNEGGPTSWAEQKYEEALTKISKGNTEGGLTALKALIEFDRSVPVPHYLMGVVYLENGELEAARRKFNDALSVQPLFLEAKYMLGMLAIEEKDYRTAKALFKDLLDIPAYEAMGFHGLAMEVLDRGGVSWAITYFEESIKADSTFMDSYGPLVTLSMYGGHVRRARKFLDQGLRVSPEWERGIVMHAIIALLTEGDMEVFEKDLNRLIGLSPDNYHYLFMRAGLLIEKQQWHEAVMQYREAYSLDTTSQSRFNFTSKIEKDETLRKAIDYYFDHYDMRGETRLILEQGICEMIRKDFSAARKQFKSANSLEETPAGLTFYAVMANEFWKSPEQVIPHYDAVIKADSLHAFAYAERGDLLIETGDMESAFLDFDQLVDQYPGEKYGWKKRGLILGELGKTEFAYDDFSEAIKLDSLDDELFFNRALMASRLQKFGEAEKDLDYLLTLTPEDGEAWYLMHSAQLAQEDSLDALVSLDSASVRLYGREDVHRELLDLAQKLDKPLHCENALTRLIQNNPVHTMYVLERGKFYYGQQQYGKALADLKEFTNREKRLGVGYHYLSLVYAAMGEDKKAIRYQKKAAKYGYAGD